jgi:hypothetical protein
MAETELTLRDIVQRLPQADASHLPAPDLWPRIAAAHLARSRRRRVQRYAAGGLLAASVLLATLVTSNWLAKSAPNVDWQARAQALELQLNALSASADSGNPIVVQAELARVDSALQAAYDRGATANELTPLWKQRSDLLSALLVARQQQVALTRI